MRAGWSRVVPDIKVVRILYEIFMHTYAVIRIKAYVCMIVKSRQKQDCWQLCGCCCCFTAVFLSPEGMSHESFRAVGVLKLGVDND